MSELWPHQAAEVPRLLSGHRLLAWEPGTGKTRAILEAFRHKKLATPAARMLVIVPANLRAQWAAVALEAGFSVQDLTPKDTFSKLADIVVVSYHAILNVKMWKTLMAEQWAVLTLDEAHYCKTPTTKWVKGIFGARKNSPACLMRRSAVMWLMTGTPITKDPSDLWVFVSRLFTDILDSEGIQNRNQWIERWCLGYNTPYGFKVTGARDSARLHELLAPYMSRVLKKDVLKDRKEPLFDRFRLPPRKIDLSEVGAEEIARIAELLDGDFDLSELENDPAVTSLRKLLGVSKALEVGDLIVDEVRNTGAKQLVFYHHTDVGMSIFKLLHGEGLKPVIYNGNSTAKQKQMALHLFKNDPECLVFIGQMDASGTGLDGLQIASRVHIVEEPWTPAKLDQVVSRADRGGQLGQVHVTSYVIAGSYDEKVSKKIEERTRIINAVIDGQKEGKAA